MIVEFITKKEGSVIFIDKTKFREAVKQIEDGFIKLTLSKWYNKRTNPQNAYYFGVIVLSCQKGLTETHGIEFSNEDAHEFLKINCNFVEICNTNTGEVTRLAKSTAKLETVPFNDYCQRCRDFIYEWFNILVPEPNEK